MSSVTFETDGDVGVVTLDRPPLNLLTFNMLGELNDVLDEAAATPIRSLLLRAGGEHFMAGADVHVFDGVSTREARRVFERGLPVLATLENLPFPTVAAVRGLCLAAGLELVLGTDIVVAGQGARFAQVEIRIGTTTLLGGVQRLAERCGPARARQIIFDGDQYSAEQFAAWNIINHVVPDAEVETRALELARRYAAGPTRAYDVGKQLVRGALEGGTHAADRLIPTLAAPLFETDDMRAAVTLLLTHGARALQAEKSFSGK